MPLIKEIHIGKGLLLLWEITEELEWLEQQFPHLASDETFISLKNKKRQREWLAVKMMLKHIGCKDFNVYYNENYQPQINHKSYPYISISHSKKMAGILIHPTNSVGLDIESLDRNFIQVEKKYLSTKEIELAHQAENRHCLFWCAKEAIYKMAGIPGLHFAEQIILNVTNKNELIAELIADKKNNTFQLDYIQYDRQLVVFLIDNQ